MATGTFIIRPTALSSGDTPLEYVDSGPSSPPTWYILLADLLDPHPTLLSLVASPTNPFGPSPDPQGWGYIQDGSVGNTADKTLRATFLGTSIYLDGSPTPIQFASLPAGFTATAASVKVEGVAKDELDAVATYYLQHGNGNDGPINNSEYPYDFSGPDPTILTIWSNGLGIRILLTLDPPPSLASVRDFYNLHVEGTYDIVSFTFTGTVETPSEPVDEGEEILAESDPDAEHPVDFTQVLTVKVIGPDGTEYPVLTFEAIDEFHFSFIIPSFGGDTPTVLTIVITSTQFSGSVTLGQLITIYFTSASGIYRLVTNKRNDTLYIEDNLPETVDVKIPNPTWKTGFAGG